MPYLLKRMAVVIMAGVAPLCGPARSMNIQRATSPAVLRGIVSLDGDPWNGTITVSSGSEVLQTVANYSFVNGTFAVSLNAPAEKAITTGHARITVETVANNQPQKVHLTADVQDIDPNRVVVFVNPVTSIISAYLDLNTQTIIEDPAEQVGLALATGTLPQSPHITDFDSHAFLAQSELNGGFDNFVKQVAWEITTGSPLSIPRMTEPEIMARVAMLDAAGGSLAPAGEMRAAAAAAAAVSASTAINANDLILALVKNVCSAAASKVGGVFAGWVLDQILGPTGNEARVDSQLKEIGKQQQKCLTAYPSFPHRSRMCKRLLPTR